MPPENVRRVVGTAGLADVPIHSLSATHVVIVAGKGGVGKTTVTAVLARAAADLGRRVLVVELDGKPALRALLPDLDVRTIVAADALEEYLREHGFARIARRLAATGVIDVVGTAAPGIDDVVVLGKIKQLERSGAWDLIVVDGPAAGHAITFLTSAAGLADAARGGPVRAQADEVLELLQDAERCQVVLVTLPETTPVNELVETAYALEDLVGVQLGPVVVNAVDDAVGGMVEVPDPDLVDASTWSDGTDETGETDDERRAAREAARFRRARVEVERRELARLDERLPLDQVWLPALAVAGLDADDVRVLAARLRGDAIRLDPDGSS